MEQVRGFLERVTFHNAENGYIVARIRPTDGKEPITMVGYLHNPLIGEELKFSGQWVKHPKFGRQFQFSSSERILPTSTEGIFRFLSSGAIRGIGPVTARRLLDHFGEETLDVLEHNPQKLTEMGGIGEKKLSQIVESYQEMRGLRDVMVFLEGHGVSGTYSARILSAYGEMALKVLRENPYLLSQEIHGIGFRIADRIARASGLDMASDARIDAGIFFTLERVIQSGHVCLPQEALKKEATLLLEVDGILVEERLRRLIQRRDLDVEMVGGDTLIYPDFLYFAEKKTARHLLELQKAAKQIPLWMGEGLLKSWEEQNQLNLADAQREAISLAVSEGTMILTGGPGTGKTTTIRGILEVLIGAELKVLLAAPTGRAAKRLAETTGYEATTIHRLLEAEPSVEGGLRFTKDEDNPLEADAIIIDESSMIDLVLIHHLLLAVPSGCRLIFAGDADQLPSVGAGSVLKDMIRSEVIPTVRLTEIFRQAEESAIIRNAHRINQGQMPIFDDREFIGFFSEHQEEVVEKIVTLCTKELLLEGYHPLRDVQVLSPMHRQLVGVANLNQSLQEALNPPEEGEIEIKYGELRFRVGDKVMQTKNNYEKKVFNGDIGRVWEITEGKMMVRYPDWDVTYEAGQMDELSLAYAMSVHKSQGSEYPVVILPLMTGHSIMLQRNLLYTAVTRAKEKVILLGSKRAIQIAVQTERTRKRYSLLAERLREEDLS